MTNYTISTVMSWELISDAQSVSPACFLETVVAKNFSSWLSVNIFSILVVIKGNAVPWTPTWGDFHWIFTWWLWWCWSLVVFYSNIPDIPTARIAAGTDKWRGTFPQNGLHMRVRVSAALAQTQNGSSLHWPHTWTHWILFLLLVRFEIIVSA